MEERLADNRRPIAPKMRAETKPAMDYLFLSGVLALDLVNTEVLVRGKRYDLFATPVDVADWWREAIMHNHDGEKIKAGTGVILWSTQLLEMIKQVRVAIKTLCTNLLEHQPYSRE